MREFRKSKDCTEHYTSFEELRKGFGLKPIKRKTDDAEKLKAQQEKFLGTCRVCKHGLVLVKGTNILTCQNPDCKGMKITSNNEEDDSEKVWYVPVTRMLDGKGMEIAENLFE